MSFKSNIKKFIIAGLLFSILFNIQKEHLNFGSPHNIVCDMCYHAKKINSFPRKGQLNKSGNSSISQGKFDFFKEVRGKWHIPAYSPKFNMFHWQNIVSRN